MCKPTQFVIMSLVLFMTVLLIGAVSNESVNKSVLPTIPPPLPSSIPVAAVPAIPAAPVHGIIADHMDLPTKFGDEDDVIEGKAAAEKKASENAGIGSSASRNDDDDDHYDEDDDDFLSRHISDKTRGGSSHHRDNDESEADYDDSDLGPTLDNFGEKLDGSDAGNELPIFLEEPQHAYAVRNRPAVLKCKAAHALEVCYYHIFFLIINTISLQLNGFCRLTHGTWKCQKQPTTFGICGGSARAPREEKNMHWIYNHIFRFYLITF